MQILAALCNIVLNYFFIQSMGYFGAAVATAIAHGLQFGFHYICARFVIRKGEFPFGLKMLLPYAVPFLAVAVLCTVSQDYALLRWGIGAALGLWEVYRSIKRKKIF